MDGPFAIDDTREPETVLRNFKVHPYLFMYYRSQVQHTKNTHIIFCNFIQRYTYNSITLILLTNVLNPISTIIIDA